MVGVKQLEDDNLLAKSEVPKQSKFPLFLEGMVADCSYYVSNFCSIAFVEYSLIRSLCLMVVILIHYFAN